MSSQPLFTIATITYNSSQWVRETIESVLASIYTDFEYIISDDCSTDNTWEIIQEYKDPRIRAWRNETNIGEYPNRQKVLEAATGKYILYIDGDDILYKGTLRNFAEFLDYFPKADAIWGIDYNNQIVFPYQYSPLELTRYIYLGSSPIPYMGFSESLFRTEALMKIGGMPVDLTSGDTYLKKRFACLYNVLVVPAGNTFWRIHNTQASNKIRSGLTGFIENHRIDKEILFSSYIPLQDKELKVAQKNFSIRTVKLLVSKTIFRFKIFKFFRLLKKLHIPFLDLKFLFFKVKESYKENVFNSTPLINHYNFERNKPTGNG
ncbi:MAG: glycosyltransferase family 2 protein [Chitinophagaceae bacterium]|nr:glycosyltransferase family 2 protein [Chitinophagaceae bacterium]MCZ2397316.1 glycosyltransferase [Chitinophagales bacterium]